MSEVKDVRAALDRYMELISPMDARWEHRISQALVSEGLAACDTLERVSLDDESGRRWSTLETIWQTRVDVFASILKRAGLL